MKKLSPFLLLLLLSACAGPENAEWQNAQYTSVGKLPVGIMGPSGPIGP